MDTIKEFLNANKKAIGIGMCIAGATLFVLKKVGKRKRVCGVDYPADVVLLHQYSKGMFVPNISHFVVKLEMYFRLANIKFQPVYDKQVGPKHKIPWIEYNGVTMGDSQLIMNYLNRELNVDLNRSLNPEQRAVAWGIQKWIEEFTYLLNVRTRWDIFLKDMLGTYLKVPSYRIWFVVPMVRMQMKNILYYTGIGRHTSEEIFEMMTFDLQQLSTILGDKKYLMGGDVPTEVDCAAFGVLSQIRWHTPDQCPGKRLMKEKLTNLMSYTDRIKEQYWPDWDQETISGSASS